MEQADKKSETSSIVDSNYESDADSDFQSGDFDNDTLYTFVKSFVSSARRALEALSARSTQGDFVQAIAGVFGDFAIFPKTTDVLLKTSGNQASMEHVLNHAVGGNSHPFSMIIQTIACSIATIGASVRLFNTGFQAYDKVCQKNKKMSAEAAISTDSPGSEQFEEAFRKVYIRTAIEIFFAYENQLNSVFRKTSLGNSEKNNKNEESLRFASCVTSIQAQKQALQILSEYAGLICFGEMVRSSSTTDLEKSLTSLTTFDKLSSYYDQVTWNRLRIRPNINNSDHVDSKSKQEVKLNEENYNSMKKSTFEFYSDPVPAFTTDRKCEKISSPNYKNSDHVDLMLKSKTDWDKLKKISSQFQSFHLRRPFRSEFEEFYEMSRDKWIKIQQPCGLQNPETFIWMDRSQLVDILYEKLNEEKPTKQTAHVWEDLSKMKESLQSQLNTIEGDVKQILRIVSTNKPNNSNQNYHSHHQHESFQRHGLWFEVVDPIDSFCGREEFLQEIHTNLFTSFTRDKTSGENSVGIPNSTILSRVKVISGLGGLGKTETAKMYIFKYGHFYNNVIWINAENKNSMKDSFLKLAKELEISFREPEDTLNRNPVYKIYRKLCAGGQKTLVVFDNADDFQNGIANFIPTSLNPLLEKPSVLVTSRNQAWPNGVQVLQLDVLSTEQSINIIQRQISFGVHPETNLNLNITNKQELVKLAQILGGLPLALQQCAAFIHQQNELSHFTSGKAYTISNYLDDFGAASSLSSLKKSSKNNSCIPNNAMTSINVTWDVTLNKIKSLQYGGMAIKIMDILAFLYADNVPLDLLNAILTNPQVVNYRSCSANSSRNSVKEKLLPVWNKTKKFFTKDDSRSNEYPLIHSTVFRTASTWSLNSNSQIESSIANEIAQGLLLLKKYSMVTNSGRSISIHRQVQFVTLLNLCEASNSKIPALLKALVRSCVDIFPIFQSQYSQLDFDYRSAFLMNMLSIVDDHWNLIPKSLQLKPEWVEFEAKFAGILCMAGKYTEALALCQKVYQKRKLVLGESHFSTLSAQNQLAFVLTKKGKYNDAFEILCTMMERKQRTRLEENHPDLLQTKNQMANVLDYQGNFSQAFQLYKTVLEKRVQTLGKRHPETLKTQQNLASALVTQGKYEEALEHYREVYDNFMQIYKDNPFVDQVPEVVSCQHSIAQVLACQEKYDEALDLYKTVYKKRVKLVGELHPDTLSTRHNMAEVFEKKGQLEKALVIFEQVYENRVKSLGSEHPKTIVTKKKLEKLKFKKDGTF